MRGLVSEGRVPTLVIIVVEISRHALLRVGQVAEHGPLAWSQLLGLEPRPQALSLRVVQAFVAAALRALATVLVEQGAVGGSAVLPAPVGVDEQARRGRLRLKSALQSASNQLFGNGGHDVLAHHLLADHILVRAQVGPLAVSQRQTGEVTEPIPD